MVPPSLHDPYDIECNWYERFPTKIIRSNFFSLVFILEGTGIQTLNDHIFKYKKGNLFLITPQDHYGFDITEKSRFFILRFHQSFLVKSAIEPWINRMDFILGNASHRPGCILKNKPDKPLMAALITAVTNEYEAQQIYHTTIAGQLVQAIILVVARNIALKLPKNVKETTGEPILDILEYIQRNIADPSKIKAEVMSKALNISSGYLGKYFKKQTGETLQQYIQHYKMRLVEMRLLHSDMRINEIVTEFGFSDESHLNRIFKKFRGVSPTVYRQSQR